MGSAVWAVLGCNKGSAKGDSASGSPAPAEDPSPNNWSRLDDEPPLGMAKSEKSFRCSAVRPPGAPVACGPSKSAKGSWEDPVEAGALIGSSNKGERTGVAPFGLAAARGAGAAWIGRGDSRPTSKSAKGSSWASAEAVCPSIPPDRCCCDATPMPRTDSSKLPIVSRSPLLSAASLPAPRG